MAQVQVSGGYKQLSATANCSPNPCNMLGVFCSSASGTPSVTIYDSATTTTTTKIVDTFTPVAGTWYPFPAACSNGLYVVIAATTSITVFYD